MGQLEDKLWSNIINVHDDRFKSANVGVGRTKALPMTLDV